MFTLKSGLTTGPSLTMETPPTIIIPGSRLTKEGRQSYGIYQAFLFMVSGELDAMTFLLFLDLNFWRTVLLTSTFHQKTPIFTRVGTYGGISLLSLHPQVVLWMVKLSPMAARFQGQICKILPMSCLGLASQLGKNSVVMVRV